jgi:tryptophanyl-tRNA synthetase
VNHGDRRKKIMTTIADKLVYDKCKERIQAEVNSTLKVINESMNESEPDIKKLSNLFIILSNLNQSIALLNTIKPIEKEA